MTEVLTAPPPGAAPLPGQPVAAEPPPSDAPTRAAFFTTGTALTILGALLLGFLLDATVVGQIRHDRDRQVAYAQFRYDLANGTAPTGSLDSDGKPVAAGRPVALLEIPDIGLREVVSYGTTSSVLIAGPGLRRDTPLPGQASTSVIFGRRALYGGPFRYINQLTENSAITVTTGQAVSRFKVIDVRHAGDPVPQELIDSPASLVLITSDGSAYLPQDVVRVDAVLVDPARVQPEGPVGAAVPADRELASDPSGWIPLVFWGQALVLAAIAVTWLRSRWGVRQSWLVGVPVLLVLGLAIADTAVRLLPNVM